MERVDFCKEKLKRTKIEIIYKQSINKGINKIQYPINDFRIILLFLKCYSLELPVILFDVKIADGLICMIKELQALLKIWHKSSMLAKSQSRNKSLISGRFSTITSGVKKLSIMFLLTYFLPLLILMSLIVL